MSFVLGCTIGALPGLVFFVVSNLPEAVEREPIEDSRLHPECIHTPEWCARDPLSDRWECFPCEVRVACGSVFSGA